MWAKLFKQSLALQSSKRALLISELLGKEYWRGGGAHCYRTNTISRYGRGFTKDFGFAVVNGVSKPAAYIVKYDAYSFDQVKVVKVGNKPITAFAISQDGAILAFASADLSITLLDALSFKVSCIATQ